MPRSNTAAVPNEARHPVTNSNSESTDHHPYNYYRRDGDPLRPAPARIKNNPAWYPMRKFLLRGLRPVGKYAVPAMPGDYPDRLNDLYWEGDELMDNVVTAIKQKVPGASRATFSQAMREGIDSLENPPAAFVALFEQLERVPDWVDTEEVRKGAAFYSNLPFWGIAIGAFLPTLFTTHGYATSIPVGATGRLVRQKENRMIESLHFITSVTERDGLERFRYGFECAVHVRLMHAFVRKQMYRKNRQYFDYATDGDPMSQPDTLVGIPVFGILNLLVARAYGVNVTEEQLRSIDMLWRYVVYLMGGHEDAIPKSLEESLFLLDYYIATQGKPSVFTDELNKALFVGVNESVQERAPAWQRPLIDFLFRDFVGSFTWHMVGDELAREVKYLKKPNALTKHLPSALRAWTRFQDLTGAYQPNYTWNDRFHHDGSFVRGYKKLMQIREDETEVTFRAHDDSDARNFGQASKYAS